MLQQGDTLQKGHLFTPEWFKDIMVFFTNRCKNRNCPLLKNSTLQPSTVLIHWIACRRGSFLFVLFFSHLIFQMNLHHFFFICGPGSSEKSLGTNPRRAEILFSSAVETKARESAVLCTGQSSLSDSVSYCAESSGAGSRSQTRFCWWGAAWLRADGAHEIGVGGVLLSIRMVRGLYGNCVDPDKGKRDV